VNPTGTPTYVPAGGISIDEVTVYPCPVRKDTDALNLLVAFSGRPAKVTMKIYTTAFRCIREETWDAGLTYPACTLSVAAYKIATLANGTYYYIIQAEDGTGIKSNRKVQIFVVLR
jgi:hypothetical protein